MKFKGLLTIFSLIMLMMPFWLIGQDDRLDDFSFDEQPIQQERIPYFAIAGGVTMNFHFNNFDELNKHLTDKNFDVGKFEGQMIMVGGEGFTGLVYIKDMRIGIFSYTGTKELEKSITLENQPYKRSVDYTSRMWGLSLDYAFVPFKKFAILPGLTLGHGYLSLNTIQAPDKIDWSNYKPEFYNLAFQNQLETGYWAVKPTLNFEYALTNFLMIRAGASYNFTFGYDWKFNKNATAENVPDKISGDGMSLQFGIFLGLFNY